MRVQLYDGARYIEAVAFNFLIEKLECLNINDIYLVKNGIIRPCKHTYRAWPNQSLNSPYDIILRQDTVFVHLKNGKLNMTHINQREPNDTSDTSDIDTSTHTAIITSHATNTSSSSSRQNMDTYDKIDQLIFKRSNTYVNVIGIIHHIHELKYTTSTYGSRLELLNLDLVDDTKCQVRVAVWGRDAKQFNHKSGECIMLKHVKICTYGGGLSLSVVRESCVYNLTTTTTSSNSTHYEYLANLTRWYACWQQECEQQNDKPVTLASKIQQVSRSKKRSHSSIEYSIAKSSTNKYTISESPRKKPKTK